MSANKVYGVPVKLWFVLDKDERGGIFGPILSHKRAAEFARSTEGRLVSLSGWEYDPEKVIESQNG